MKFGADLPNYGPAATSSSTLDWARRMEELGYLQLMVSDHMARTPEVPLQVARQVANIDQLSGGRFVFGAAAGRAPGEFATLGVPYQRRGARSNEYLRVMKAFWSQDIIAHNDEFVRFGPVHTGPRPVQPAVPPVWIGGTARAPCAGPSTTATPGIPPPSAPTGWCTSGFPRWPTQPSG
ncbi:LLM class flavin-dependent oxidoreductase [Streptomyces sp. NBC_00820]|uniref:LLM class flavin-dependent oxidoreductase n=1 Tax=Streptomyces sp. NBC_00820 TaxID=2975842 RepID=UPI002ED43B69|nr:LLM class flavin-dependent oxidoreductase [Streptomyces sp. NBC_00820]